MTYLGIDIGGANIKLADTGGYAAAHSFPLWREPQRLAEVLADCLRRAPPHRAIAATTTAELADCFATKREGIRAVYSALAAATDRPIGVYLVDGRFVSPEAAIEAAELASASNWHALGRLAGQMAGRGHSLLIDVGSTTADIIPLRDGEPCSQGRTDTQRLLHGELVYTGVARTPAAALVTELPWRGTSCPIARELFATSLDAHLLLGHLPEDAEDYATADGGPATCSAAHARLARMICADVESFDLADAIAAAESIASAQRSLIAAGIVRVATRLAAVSESPASAGCQLGAVIVAGQGEFLAQQALAAAGVAAPRIISLGERLGGAVSQAAAAYAVAMLAAQLESPSTPQSELTGAAP